MSLTNIAPEAQSILEAHASRLALPVDDPVDLKYSLSDLPYRWAKQATLHMGFIEIDAECIARAWLAQTLRLGQFDPMLWPSEPADFGLKPWPRNDAFAACPKKLGLYAVLPDAQWVGRMARAGVPTVQLRFKSDDATTIAREVAASVAAVQGTNALLFINDHWQSAIDAGAYGVHWGRKTWTLPTSTPYGVPVCDWVCPAMATPRC
jgi:thiamine-phosphate pyrophosphorylase